MYVMKYFLSKLISSKIKSISQLKFILSHFVTISFIIFFFITTLRVIFYIDTHKILSMYIHFVSPFNIV